MPQVIDEYYKTHGLTNPFTGKSMRAEVEAARGGSGGGAAPVRVQTVEEARKLPSGTPIILPDGRPGRVP
jgi:hypothetical protein